MPWVSSGSQLPFVNACVRATNDDFAFSHFKTTMEIVSVIGLAEPSYGFTMLSSSYNDISASLSASLPASSALSAALATIYANFALNDTLGGSLYTLGTRFGPISGETLRYAGSTGMIVKAFGNLSGSTIVEFGPFVGGLAHSLLSYYTGSISQYYMIDLPEVQDLSKKYFQTMSYTVTLPYDTASLNYDSASAPSASNLFISEYALTEYTEPDLTNYFKQYVSQSAGFFIRSNFIDPSMYYGFVASCSVNFNVTASEEPKIRTPNVILIGLRK